jgi:hypothetical protein
MAVPLHVGDVGGVLRLTVMEDGAAKNIASASTTEFRITKPDGTVVTVTASFNSTGADGKLIYVFQTGDLNLAGDYIVCIHLVLGGFNGHTTPYAFTVKPVGQ